MYAVVYAVRMGLNWDGWFSSSWKQNVDPEFLVGFISLVLTLDILWSVFVTHRSTYQEDLDVLQVKHIVPGCLLLATLVRVHFPFWSTAYSYVWSATMYADVVALMPQVVMMARASGKI